MDSETVRNAKEQLSAHRKEVQAALSHFQPSVEEHREATRMDELENEARQDPARLSKEVKEIEELEKECEKLKESTKQLQGENETLLARLEEQGKKHEDRFGFQFESASIRTEIQEQFTKLYHEALEVAQKVNKPRLAGSESRITVEDCDTVRSLMDILQLVVKKAEEHFGSLRCHLKGLLQEMGVEASEAIVESDILTDLVRHIARTTLPDSSSKDKTPYKFQQEMLVAWSDLDKTRELRAFRRFLPKGMAEEELHDLLQQFLKLCCDFSWHWLMFRARGTMETDQPSLDFDRRYYQPVEEGTDCTGKPVKLVWPVLRDKKKTVIEKGRVVPLQDL